MALKATILNFLLTLLFLFSIKMESIAWIRILKQLRDHQEQQMWFNKFCQTIFLDFSRLRGLSMRSLVGQKILWRILVIQCFWGKWWRWEEELQLNVLSLSTLGRILRESVWTHPRIFVSSMVMFYTSWVITFAIICRSL